MAAVTAIFGSPLSAKEKAEAVNRMYDRDAATSDAIETALLAHRDVNNEFRLLRGDFLHTQPLCPHVASAAPSALSPFSGLLSTHALLFLPRSLLPLSCHSRRCRWLLVTLTASFTLPCLPIASRHCQWASRRHPRRSSSL
jgi:hypothetical protein